MTPLTDEKRSYLKRVVNDLKASGVLQRDIAARMDESEGALSGRMGGQRGIPDDYIDRFSKEFDVPFTVGKAQGVGTVPDEKVEQLLAAVNAQSSVLMRVLDRLELLTNRKG